MTIIDKAWRIYSETVIPVEACDVQRAECRRSFYAGACALINALMDAAELEVEGDALDTMVVVAKELEEFKDGVKAGLN